ncbi:TIR domain-containing protein [Pseudobutyrivibrio xylanivorans]|uniref:TIR domain-containing protein n=1 Tax=Pseudobutyrivibrio xylanivorans TaxID=185007 RepID=A0A5P6VQ65_PSEXY|nr:TIR domain-containing protein [Pseudobutyrivibrio xylanivorans]QFJ53829.1 TIR domain-containing protein [Pseudobutyrivibrio xylanivorans]
MDAFISYRRDTGSELASNIRTHLCSKGLDVFFDKDKIGNEDFTIRIKEEISKAPNFIMILTKGYFTKKSDHDRVREEIEYAVEQSKNFILIYKAGYQLRDDTNWDDEDDYIKKFETYNRHKWDTMSISDEEVLIDKIIRQMKGEDGLPFKKRKTTKNNSYYSEHGMDEADFLWIKTDHTVCRGIDWNILERAITQESIFKDRNDLNLLVYKAYDIETYAKKYALNPKRALSLGKRINPGEIYGVTYRGLLDEADRIFQKGHFIADEFATENYIDAVKKLMSDNQIEGFDIIDLTLILKDMPEPEKTLRELAKLLNPDGGIIYIRELDDDYIDGYPDEAKLIPKLKEILELDDGAGYRHLGKKVYTYLIRAGADKVYISDEILSTANHKTAFQLAMCHNYFSYLLPEMKALSEDNEKNRANSKYDKYVEAYSWLLNNYDDVESLFCSPDFYFRAGYVAGYGVFEPDDELF